MVGRSVLAPESFPVAAQMAAGRICLKQLNRPQEALAFYEAAAASPIPHLDWEQTIAAAIRDARKTLEPVTAGASR